MIELLPLTFSDFNLVLKYSFLVLYVTEFVQDIDLVGRLQQYSQNTPFFPYDSLNLRQFTMSS